MSARKLAIGVTGMCFASLVWGGASALASDRCVGGGHGCHRTIQAAVDAAHDGDRIRISAGSFAGGVVIDKSLTLSGAGPGTTTIRGGGPVLTIGTLGASDRPTVSISGVKITGGRTTSSPESEEFFGGTVFARGGGVFIPPGAGNQQGATVSISHSAIVGNRVAPASLLVPDPGDVDAPPCAAGPCPFAAAEGGGISNFGTLTLTDSLVKDNEASGANASEATGGGIWSNALDLVVVRSAIVGNRAVVVAPNGRFAEGGGVFVAGGSLTVRESDVSDNLSSLCNTLPVTGYNGSEIQLQAHAGAIQLNDGASALIERSRFTGNVTKAVDPNGAPSAFDSALLTNDSPLTLRDTLIAGNHVLVVGAQVSADGPSGTAVEADGGGLIERSRIVDNEATVIARSGDAGVVGGGLAVFNFSEHPPLPLTVRDSVIARNHSRTKAAGGALAQGGGIFNNALLDLERARVADNVLAARGTGGVVEGGGIWNGAALSGPPVELALTRSEVTGNVLRAGEGLTASGGGLFTTFPVALVQSPIAGNRPDQCVGCELTAAAARPARSSARRATRG